MIGAGADQRVICDTPGDIVLEEARLLVRRVEVRIATAEAGIIFKIAETLVLGVRCV
jgi:hypothetical protein